MRKLMIVTILALLTATAVMAFTATAFTANGPAAPKKSVYVAPLTWRADGTGQYKFENKVNLHNAEISGGGSVETNIDEGTCELSASCATDGLIYGISANWQFTGKVTMEVSATGRASDYKTIVNGVPLDYSGFMPGSQLKWRAKLGPGSTLTEVTISYTDLSGTAGSFGSPDLSGFTVKKEIYIKGSSREPLYNFQIPIRVGESHKAGTCDAYLEGPSRSDLSDIRFTCADGETSLAYYRESLTGQKPDREALFWVKIPEIPKDGLPIYMYYGKDGAADLSDGEKVFDFFDDFSASQLDNKKWKVALEGKESRADVAASILAIDAARVTTAGYSFRSGVIEYRAKVNGNGGIAGIIAAGQTAGNDLSAYASIIAASAHCIVQGDTVIVNDPKQIELDKYYNFRVVLDKGDINYRRYGDSSPSAPQAEARCSIGSGTSASPVGLSAGTGGSGLYCEWIRTRKYADPLPEVDRNRAGKEAEVNLPVFYNLTLAPDGSVITAGDAQEGVYTSAPIHAPYDARILTATWVPETSETTSINVGISTNEGSSYYSGWQNGAAKYASKGEFQKGSELRYKATITKKIGTVPSGDSPYLSNPGLKLFSLAYYPGTIKILLPVGGEKMSPGGRYNIFWAAEGYEPSYGMDLYYSSDGGQTYEPIAAKIPNNGSYTWTVPDEETAEAVVKAADPYDTGVYGTSGVFEITKSVGEMKIGEENGKEGEDINRGSTTGEEESTPSAEHRGGTKTYEILVIKSNHSGRSAQGKELGYVPGDPVVAREKGSLWTARELKEFDMVEAELTPVEAANITKPKEIVTGLDDRGRPITKIIKKRMYRQADGTSAKSGSTTAAITGMSVVDKNKFEEK